jgi:PAS domain S-box-containing protein
VIRSAFDTSSGRITRLRIGPQYLRSWLGPAMAIALVAAALTFDAMTPQVISVTLFYVTLVLVGFWFPQPKAALALALLATPLIIIGYWLAIPGGTPVWEGWTNRSLSICSVWLTAAFVWHIRILGQKLQRQIDIASDLSRQMRWLASIVEFGNDAIISKNLDGIITSWNKGAERLFGYSAEEAIGQPVTILVPPESADEEYAILRYIRRGDHIEPYETVRRRKDASLIDISLTVSPVRDAEGKIIGASRIARDITERKRSEAQISILAGEAEHRAKNLLANVKAMVQLSQADTPDGLREAIAGRITALANVHSLFVQSRWTGAELGSLVKQELSPYSREGEARTSIGGPTVMLKPDVAQAIAVVLHELATNAAKYGPLSVAKGVVRVEWSCTTGGRVVLRWTEMGGPPASPPTHKGFGTRVMGAIMRGRVGGDVRLDWHAEGLRCEIALPIQATEADGEQILVAHTDVDHHPQDPQIMP